MSINFSHTVKAESVQMHYTTKGARLHAAGCQHRADSKGPVKDANTLVAETETVYVDDYYDVAPCARKAA
jgi:hypothetical protein